MNTAVRQRTKRDSNPFVMRVWRGQRNARDAYFLFLGGLLALDLSPLTFAVSLGMSQRGSRLSLVSLGCLLLTFILFISGIRALFLGAAQLGAKRLILYLVLLFVAVGAVVGMLTPGSKQSTTHWGLTAAYVIDETIARMRLAADLGINGLSRVRRFTAGENTTVPATGIVWIDGASPPANAADQPTAVPTATNQASKVPTSAPPTNRTGIQVGDTVKVVGTGSVSLRMRQSPSTKARIVGRAAEGTVLSIVGGPETAEGHTWWKVRGSGIEGWCAAEFLALAET